MDLIQLFVVVVVFGLLFWLVQAYLPIPQPFKNIALAILVLAACAWLLNLVGLWGGVGTGTIHHHT